MPVVAHVGGRVDTVIDANPATQAAEMATGIQFAPVTAAGPEHAIARAARLWRQPKTWARMQRNGMRGDYGWDGLAAGYRTFRRYGRLRPAGCRACFPPFDDGATRPDRASGRPFEPFRKVAAMQP